MAQNRIRFNTAVSIVIANMIGTGVFTSLGFQLLDIRSVFALLMLWVVGGITALCGALTYGELGAALPRSGGEYNFLTRLIHPSAGFVAGWVSATVGFAAPTALVAMTFGEYVSQVFPQLSSTLLAVSLVVLITAVHATSVQQGGRFQRVFTAVKVLLVLGFIGAALSMGDHQELQLLPQQTDWAMLYTPAFAVSLIYVSYAYTGWNAATYLIDELDRPAYTLPRALLVGTLVVMVLYVLLNYAFLYSAPMEELSGEIEVGYISAVHIFGSFGGELMAVILALLLISTASAMIFAGPRVIQVMGEDFPAFEVLAHRNSQGVPSRAVIFQSVISLIFIITASFEAVLVYAGFILGITTLFTVLSIFVLRWKHPDKVGAYRTWAYPIPPLIYLALVGWNLIFLLRDKTQESLAGLLTLLVAWAAYYVARGKR